MNMKKIISAISAVALSFSALASLSVVNAATTTDNSLGGKPIVKAEFVEYTTNSSKTWAKAWVKVTIDLSQAEALSVYEEKLEYDEIEEDDVLVKYGNGLKTAGFAIEPSNKTDFETQTTNNTSAAGWVMDINAATGLYTAAFGPKQAAAEYYTENTATFIVNYKTKNFDATTDISLVDVTLGGYDQKGGAWSYLSSDMDIVGLTIPSYNEWSKPAEPEEPEIKINDKYVFNFTADADQDVMVKLTRTNGIVSDLTYALPELVKGKASIFGLLKVTDNTVVSGDKFDISVVDANRNPVKEITSIVVD